MNKGAKMKGRTFVFLGISGSGKGTQTGFLMKVLAHAKNISTGDGLRSISKKKNIVGRYISGILHRGGLTPYWAPASIWLTDFVENLHAEDNLVFDGAPRLVKEAQMMDDFMKDVDRPLPVAIYIKLSRGEAFRRLIKRGRYDDNKRAIQGRFAFFKMRVQPVIQYYKNRKRLVVINGDQDANDVWRDIRKAVRL